MVTYSIDNFLSRGENPGFNTSNTAYLILNESLISTDVNTPLNFMATQTMDSLSELIDSVDQIRSYLISTNSQVFYNDSFKQTFIDIETYLSYWKNICIILNTEGLSMKVINYNVKLARWKSLAQKWILDQLEATVNDYPATPSDNPGGNNGDQIVV